MDPHQKMHHIFHNLLRKLFSAVGHDIFRSATFKPYWLTFVVYVFALAFYVSSVYTLVFYDKKTALNCILFVGLSCQLVAKMYTAKHGGTFLDIMNKIIEVYAANSKTKSCKRAMLMNRFAFISEVLMKVGCGSYFAVGLLYPLIPVYAYVVKNEIITVLPMYMPLIDENTTIGYIILTGFHLGFMYFGIIASACSDFMFTIMISNIPVFSHILSDQVRELNVILNGKIVNKPISRAMLYNIHLMHHEIWLIIDDLNTTIFALIFVEIVAACGCAAVLLFVALKIEWFPVIVLLVVPLSEIVYFCVIGTIIETCNREIYDSINLIDWYLMPSADLKNYHFLLQNTQMTKSLTIGGLAPLNMNTCVSIFKKIYSYLMLLLSVID